MCRGTCSSVLREVEATFVAVVTAQREDPSNGEWLRARVANAVASAQFGRKTVDSVNLEIVLHNRRMRWLAVPALL